MPQESIFALTSLSPRQENAQLSAECIASWRDAGLQVRAFNHPSEIAELATLYDVDFVPVPETSAHVFGRNFVPINAMLDWGVEHDVPVLLINSDIHLRMAEWELKRVRWLSDGGLCYFIRHNHDGDRSRTQREPHGIDAFLLHGRDARMFPVSFLSMGQPFWDYWIPHTFASGNRRIYAVEFPALFHRNHPTRWSEENWYRCAHEFDRLTGGINREQAAGSCEAMMLRLRQHFDRFDQQKISVAPRPGLIREWVERTFRCRKSKTFLELGAHQDPDMAWMAAIPNVTIFAFEPDPRNTRAALRNVTLQNAAIADFDGRDSLILSEQGWGQQWTGSSSIRQPWNHLQYFPVTSDDEAVELEMGTLDSFSQQEGLGVIDFIWADIQGAEGEMIRGGSQTLARTRYLYTEYSDDELNEPQVTLREILQMLPDFRVLELWPNDVLLENRKLSSFH